MNAYEREEQIEAQKRAIPGRMHRIWIRDDWHDEQVYEVPIDALALNLDNRRFAAERKLLEKKLGRELDPDARPDDERSVMSILLDKTPTVRSDAIVGKESKDTVSLRNDWFVRGQETPFWIRPDGTVRNGNRRLAMLKRTREERGDRGIHLVHAIILDPAEYPEDDVFELEQSEQLTDNQKRNYTNINRLLAIRDAAILRGIQWGDPESIDRVAGEIQHLTLGNKKDAAVQLNAIKALDAFLLDSDSAGDYEKAYGTVESFRDIGRNVALLDPDLLDYADQMLLVCFAALRAQLRYLDIRGIRKLFFDDRAAFESLVLEVEDREEQWREGGGGDLGEPDLGDDVVTDVEGDEDDESSSDDGLGSAPVVANYPATPVRSMIRNAIDALNSKDLDVADAIEQALARLEPVDPASARFTEALSGASGSQIRSMVAAIAEWAGAAQQPTDEE
jgi:hypothetical protein